MREVFKIGLQNKNIAITGGYGYLGRAIVDSLVAHEARVFVLGRDEQKFKDEFLGIERVEFIHCDVASTQSIRDALNDVYASVNSLDVFINNAFYSKGQFPESLSDEDWSYGIEGTLGSVFRCSREVVSRMVLQRYGKLINVSSMYGLVAPQFDVYEGSERFLNPPHYGAAKAGIIQLTRYYASYYGRFGITVNCVTPGAFPSPEVQKDSRFINDLASRTCLGRIGDPKDVAGAFVFLSSDAANYITGQNIIVDGGWTAR